MANPNALHMGADSQTPELGIDPGILLGAPPIGTRAAEIRKLALDYPELNPSQIARRVGCTPQNAHQVLNTFFKPVSPEELEVFQGSKAEVYDALQFRALASITQDKLEKTSALQLVTAAAILEDKSRLVRGQPTSIHVHALVDVLDALRMRDGDE